MDWLDLLAVQGTLKALLQHHSSKASILSHSAFFMVQLSNLYMTTGETTAFFMIQLSNLCMATGKTTALNARVPWLAGDNLEFGF